MESFLLHFRNLIEFFNGNPRFDNDLNVARPTQLLQGFPQAKPEESQISSLEQPRLFEKYEGRDVNDKISRYLHHCTTQRVELKDWNLGEMYGEIEPLLTSFKELFPQVESVAHCETPRLVVGTSDGSSTQS